MPQLTNLNVSPYFDDFDPANDYYRVLFKPGYPVQARELTGLQSMLQNQIARVGLVCNPQAFDSTSLLSVDKATACGALRLSGAGYSSATFTADAYVTQTIATGTTAAG